MLVIGDLDGGIEATNHRELFFNTGSTNHFHGQLHLRYDFLGDFKRIALRTMKVVGCDGGARCKDQGQYSHADEIAPMDTFEGFGEYRPDSQ